MGKKERAAKRDKKAARKKKLKEFKTDRTLDDLLKEADGNDWFNSIRNKEGK